MVAGVTASARRRRATGSPLPRPARRPVPRRRIAREARRQHVGSGERGSRGAARGGRARLAREDHGAAIGRGGDVPRDGAGGRHCARHGGDRSRNRGERALNDAGGNGHGERAGQGPTGGLSPGPRARIGAVELARAGARVNVAVTALSALMAMEHGFRGSVQSPLQPVNAAPDAGVAATLTVAPSAYVADCGVANMEPLPAPALDRSPHGKTSCSAAPTTSSRRGADARSRPST